MKQVEVKIVLEDGAALPFYATVGSAGMDIRANIKEAIVLKPLERRLIPSGIRLGIPEGYEVQVRPRSGLALKHGITVLNTPGTIDQDYILEVGVILINLSNEDYTIQPQERIAQLVLNEVAQMELQKVISLDETTRTGGFGSTGKQ